MKNSNSLTIKTVTWSKDSHGLYDYESKNVQKKIITATQSCSIVREETDIQLHSIGHLSLFSQSLLCQVHFEFQDYIIDSVAEPIWLVARAMKTKYGPGFILSEGQVLKFGRVCFKVSMIRTENEEKPSNLKALEDSNGTLYEQDSGMCRICFNSSSDSVNPLISPCKCSGSMKYIHLLCLRYWLNSRMTSRHTENCVSFSWKSMDCEICKSGIPFSLEGKDSQIIRIEKLRPPFIVLEEDSRHCNKGVHVIGFTGNQVVTLGRGHEADVRISDISVSRCHATVKFVDGCFVVEDKTSKFGTLLKCEEKLRINSRSNAVVQIGRSVIYFSTNSSGSL